MNDDTKWKFGAFAGLLLILIISISQAANWTLSQDGKYVSWSNANALINCTAVSNELINQQQVCDFTWLGASSLTLNASFVFNVNEATPKKAYIWQNSAHTLYHDVSTPVNHSITLTPSGIYTTNASCYWGAGAIKRNLTFVNGSNTTSQVYCFDSFVNNSGTYTLYSVWNELISTPYTSWYMDWVDISSAFRLSQFGSYNVATAQGTWTSGETKKLKILYNTPVGSSGKFDIYFHTGSAAQAVADPSRIKLKLDPWWNATWGAKMQVNITNWTCNAASCTFPIYIGLNASRTNGTDVRIVNSGENATFPYYRGDDWNFTNASGTLWVNATNQTSQVYVYYNSSGASDGSNISQALGGSASEAHGVAWHSDCSPGCGFAAGGYGVKILPLYDGIIHITVRGSYTTSPNVSILDSSKAVLSTKQYSSGANMTFDYRVAAMTSYYISFTNNGATQNNLNYQQPSVTYPIGGTNMNWTGGLNNGADYASGIYGIKSLFFYRAPLNTSTPSFTFGAEEAASTTTLTFISQSPANNSIFNYSLVNYSWVLNMSGVNATLCNLSVNGTITADIVCTNSTANCSQTATTNEGISSWNITCWNGTTSTTSNTSTITIDLTYPTLAIQSPSGIYNTSNVSVNYTVYDVNRDKCWYSLNGAASVNLASCANTTIVGVEGLNNFTLYANDTAGNQRSNTTTFTVDTTLPLVSITSPTNSTYASTSVGLVYSASDMYLDACWYVLDAGAPVVLAACAGTTLSVLPQGGHTVTVFANDTLNHQSNASVSFSVDTIAPNVTIDNPVNNSVQTSVNISLNFTVDATAVSCWYTLSDTPGVNYSLAACSNTTFPGPASGSHTLTVYANDSAGNIGSYAVAFTTSYVYGVNVSVPVNGSVYSGGEVEFWFTPWGFASTNTNCTLYIDGVAGINGNCTNNDVCVVHANVSYTNGSYEEHNWSVTCIYSTQSASAGNFTLVSVPSSFGATLQSARYYIKANFNSFFSYIPIFVALAIGITLMSLGVSMGLFIGGFMGMLVAYALEALSWNVKFALGFFILVGLIIGVWGVVKTK